MLKKQPTLNDVAALAGVSYQTVSRVLNGSASVSEKTKEKILVAMKSLNYVPNRVAQQLAGKKTYVLGFATTDIALHAPSQIAASIKKYAEGLRYSVVMSMTKTQKWDDIYNVVNELLAQRVDGMIINIPIDHDEIIEIERMSADTPVLFMDVDPTDSCFSVMTDSKEGGKKGIHHLIELGHTSIALITGPKTSISARLRYEGWLTALWQRDLLPIDIKEGDWSSASGYALTTELCLAHQNYSAICFANDQMALGGLRALHELGIKVPEQISIIGYDDTEDSAFFYPPLTTIGQDFKLLGEKAVEKLIFKINNPKKKVASLVLSTHLIGRETTSQTVSSDMIKEKEFAKQLRLIADYLSHIP